MPFRHRWRILILCLAVALGAGATPLAACDPVWLPMARPDGITVFVSVALADSVLDTALAAARGRLHPEFANRLDSVIGVTRGGQRVRLLRRDGPGANREAVLVPWAYGPDCRPIAWTGRPLEWIPKDTRGAVTGWLRPEDGWIGGLPTFDVEMAWREPVWTEHEPRWPDAGPGAGRMTAEEFVQLYAALPTHEMLERDPGRAAERLRVWEREHRTLADRAPAPTMLFYVYRHAEGRVGKPRSDRESLAGRWTVEVELLESKELPLPVTARQVRGELELRVVPADTGAGSPVYSGISTIDFGPLGFRLRSTEVLVVDEPDGLRGILDPTVDHGHVVVSAQGTGGTLAGAWYLNSRPARASGRIRLRRWNR